MKFKPTWLMIKRHVKTGLLYFCKTTKTNPYSYKGSGIRWTNHLKVHGRNVETIWCHLFEDKDTLMTYALEFSRDNDIVNSEEWANLVNEDGITGWPPGTKHKASSVEKCRLNADGFKKGYIPHNKGKKHSKKHYDNMIIGQIKYRQENPNWANKWQLGKQKAEEKRIESVKKKMRGSGNHNFDPKIYIFKHKITGEVINVTRNVLIHEYKCAPQNVYRLLNNKGKSVNGWTLVTI